MILKKGRGLFAKRAGTRGGRGRPGHVAAREWPGPRRGLWTGARRWSIGPWWTGARAESGVGRVHGGPAAGAEPRSMVECAGRGEQRGRAAGRGGAPLAPLGARRGGGSRREKAGQGHQRVWRGEANAMEGSPPRNDDGKEKPDGGGFRRRRRELGEVGLGFRVARSGG